GCFKPTAWVSVAILKLTVWRRCAGRPIRKCFEHLHSPAILGRSPEAVKESAMLRILNLKKAFGGHEILKGVSFEIADRDKVALVGANGAGKSSLLKIVAGVMEADEGTVRVQGEV